MKFNLPFPKLQEVAQERPAAYMEAIEMAIANYNPNFLMIVVPNNKSDRYSALKKKTLVDRPIPTQVVLRKNLQSKGVMSIATKIAIQINCKVGGAPWSVELPLRSLMVVGFDVCHDTTNRSRAFGATVASMDKYCTSYFSSVSAHTNGEELSNDFGFNIIKAVKRYQELNNELPKDIVIYRDGVGDGQLHFVIDHEVKEIEKKLKESFYKDVPLRMAFIIVTKRIKTRIFYGNENPKPGTVVDDVITLPQR